MNRICRISVSLKAFFTQKYKIPELYNSVHWNSCQAEGLSYFPGINKRVLVRYSFLFGARLALIIDQHCPSSGSAPDLWRGISIRYGGFFGIVYIRKSVCCA